MLSMRQRNRVQPKGRNPLQVVWLPNTYEEKTEKTH